MTTAPQGRGERRGDLWIFFLLALAITWALDLPYTLACIRHVPLPAYALPMVGLGALGPTLAALAMGLWRGRAVLRGIFGHWRTQPVWIVVGLGLPLLLHVAATGIEVLLGGKPAHWLYPPTTPERRAALVMFSVGEEFGWRGYAHSRVVAQLGKVRGCLVLGCVWAIWHLGMMFSPAKASLDWGTALALAELVAWTVVFGWLFERGGRSMAVALALHAGGHLDNPTWGPETEVRLRLLRFGVTVVAAIAASWAMRKRDARTR